MFAFYRAKKIREAATKTLENLKKNLRESDEEVFKVSENTSSDDR